MPLPDERPRQSVANLIGRFEQQTKKQPPSSPGPRSSSVVSHTTGDSAKEEAKEKREWPPRTSNINSTSNDSRVSGRDWPPRLSRQSTGDSSGQRWQPIQPTIQASPFPELKKATASPLTKSSELFTPQEADKSPSPPAEPPKVIDVTPPSRKPTLVEPEPPKPVEPEPVEPPKTPPQPTVAPPTTKSDSSPVAKKSPPKTVKSTPTKPKPSNKPPPSSFTKGTSLHPDADDRRASTSARPQSRPSSRTNLRSKTPTSTPIRPPSSTQRKPPTEPPKSTPTPVRRSKTPSTPHRPPTTPSKPAPVIPKTPNSRLYAPTAASLAKSTNSPQPPPPERKKTLSSGASLERLSKPTASSLSKSKGPLSLTPTTTPPKSKQTPTRTGTLSASKKTTPTNKTKAAGSVKTSAKGDGGALGEQNGNGLAAGEALNLESVLSDTETHEPGSDCEHGHLGNGSLENSYTEELLEEASLSYQADQEHVEEPEELARSRSPESVDHAEDDSVPDHSHDAAGSEDQEQAKDEIADIVGLLESTSFSSKHILSDEGVATSESRTPGSDNERRGIGEIPDED